MRALDPEHIFGAYVIYDDPLSDEKSISKADKRVSTISFPGTTGLVQNWTSLSNRIITGNFRGVSFHPRKEYVDRVEGSVRAYETVAG